MTYCPSKQEKVTPTQGEALALSRVQERKSALPQAGELRLIPLTLSKMSSARVKVGKSINRSDLQNNLIVVCAAPSVSLISEGLGSSTRLLEPVKQSLPRCKVGGGGRLGMQIVSARFVCAKRSGRAGSRKRHDNRR